MNLMNNLLKNYLKLVLEGGSAAERQEMGIIQAINKVASPKNPVTVVTGGASIEGVIGADKMSGLSSLGQEPYTDVIFILKRGTVNISAKGSTAPSLAGGGLVALQILVPDIIERFLLKARDALAQSYKNGEMGAPDVFGKITGKDARKILRGNKEMGGPIDYMYQGPMDVKATFVKNTVTLDGVLTPIASYAKSHELYLRARKRRIDQPVDLKSVDSNGYPLLFGKSLAKGDSGRRIVITDRPSGNAILVEI
jgi:hypothetical protein